MFRHLLNIRNTRKTQTMAWFCSGSTNNELIENLFKAGLIEHERVKDAMIAVSDSKNGNKTRAKLDLRLIEPTMRHLGHTQTHLSPSDMGPPYQHHICMVMHASI
jgi:hypothetical protein